MSAIDPQGQEKYWLDGLPEEGLRNRPNDPGTETFWLNGSPAEYIYPVGNLGNFFVMFE